MSESMSESINEALIACVKACGGSKQVAPLLWPEKTPDAAQRCLLDCLNEDRPNRLSPEQVLLVLRLARKRGHHGGVDFILADLGYAPTTPIEPRDEAAELQRQFIAATRSMEAMVQRMAQLQADGAARAPVVRVVS